MAHLEKIDEMLNEAATGWKVSRMGKVELTILRLAAYEIYFDEDVPTSVAINEAVEMAKEFGGDESPAFINGVLGKMVKAETTEAEEEKEPKAAELIDTTLRSASLVDTTLRSATLIDKSKRSATIIDKSKRSADVTTVTPSARIITVG